MLGNYLDEVRKKAPLIHNITNYVTINDVANMVLACGASPIMSDEPTDIEEITSICQGLNINMGMLNPRKIESMQKAGKKSNELYHKVLLDPVGAGSSSFRTEAALNLIRVIQFDVIRGNIFHEPSVVVDTHVKRISKRLGLTKEEDPEKVEMELMKVLPKNHWILYNIQIITFGRQICFARSPKCEECFLTEYCREYKEKQKKSRKKT